uniref:Uma2 domain-containing protein n=2 Tax=Caenorhabditis tropicalis TaxID=1561998 RepID=A0A1I7T4L7_9PELO
MPSVLNNPEQFRTLLRDMLKNKRADPLILNELHELLIDREGIKMEPYIRLNEELHDVTCFDNRIIDITLKVMLPDELLIWKCEDIGHVINDTYEFYNLPPVWMVEDEDGETFKINLNDCQTKISKKAKKNPPQRPTSLELVPLIARVHYFSYNTSKVMSSLSQKILS